MKKEPKRTCAAIMFSDIVGYTALMGENEDLAYQLVKKNIRLHQDVIKKYHGKLVKEMGDGVLSSYPSGKEALGAALELQQYYQKTKEFSLRIGIHFGEILEDRHDVFGDAVNIASRLQTLGSPGSVLFSHKIREDIDENSSLKSVSLGKFKLKNVKEPLEVFALANEGLVIPKRGEMLKLLESRLKKVMVGGLVVLTLALVAFGIYHQVSINKLMAEPEKSIAVLPFENKSEDEYNSFMLAGLAEEIINGFSKIPGIKGITFSSTAGYNQSKFTPKEYGEKLGANYLLIGSFWKEGETQIFRVQLLDVKNNHIEWGDSFKSTESSSLIGFQKFISDRIISSLIPNFSHVEIDNIQIGNPAIPSAKLSYLKGKGYYRRLTESYNDSAIVEFKKAILADSTYSLAYAGLGDAYSQKNYQFGAPASYLDSCYFAGMKAIELNNRLPEGYKTVANYYSYKSQFSEANKWLEKALDKNPNFSPALGNLGSIYLSTGALDKALENQKNAASFDPGLYLPFQITGWIYRLLHDYDNAKLFLNRSIQINQDFSSITPGVTYEQLALSYLGLNQTDSAKICYQKTLEILENYKDPAGNFNPLTSASVSKIYESAGIISFFIGDINSSKSCFDKAQFYNPELLRDPFSYSLVYLSFIEAQSNFKIAEIFIDTGINLYQSASANSKEDSEYFFNLSCLYATKGDLNKSLEMLKEARKRGWRDTLMVKKNPIFKEAQKNHSFQNLMKEIDIDVKIMAYNISNPI